MTDKKMAKDVARFCYDINHKERLSVQIFIENIVLPNDCNRYAEESMERYVLEFLKSKKKIKK